jgi:hypothetical protein
MGIWRGLRRRARSKKRRAPGDCDGFLIVIGRMPMKKECINNLLGFIKRLSDYLIWGVIVFLILSIGLYFKSTNTILVVTGLIIFFYTFETYKMRRAIAENTEINIRPVVVLHFTKDNVWVENFGNFPAYNLRFVETKLTFSAWSFSKTEEIVLEFANLTMVPSKERASLLCIFADPCANPDQPQPGFFGDSNYPKKMKEGIYWLTTTVIYDDILGHSWKSDLRYHSLTGIGAGRPELIDRR